MSGIYKVRRFQAEDAEEVSALIAKTLRTVNIKDYSEEYIEANVSSHSADVLIERAEQDEFFLRAKRIEIPASITAVDFYKKMGYDHKNGIAEIDEELFYRLEKFR